MLWTIDKLRELLRKQNIKSYLSDSNLSGIQLIVAESIRAAFSTREPVIKNNKKLGEHYKNSHFNS